MKVLIVDDLGSNRRFLKTLLKDSGFSCLEAESGEQALTVIEENVDLCAVLMDVYMPGMDGLEATRLIKKRKNSYLPVIFITAIDDDETLEKCFAAGGDDFITKPLNKTTLVCRLNAHRRFYSLASNINQKNRELTYHHELIAREHAVVEHVFANVINPAMASLDFVKTYLSPMSTFSGDLYLSSTNTNGSTYLFLGDFTGHGLSAAIGCMPVADIFYAMSGKSASVADIAEESNRKLLSILPDNMFCCAVIIELNAAQDYMHIWSGGMHDVLLVGTNNRIENRVESQHMPLGVLCPDEFDKSTQVVPLTRGTRVISFTDGIVEALGHCGEFFGEENLYRAAENSESPLESILSAYKAYCPVESQEDDVSIIEITTGVNDVLCLEHVNKPVARTKPMIFGDHKTGILPWNLSVRLNPSDFSRQGLVNHVLGHMYAGGLEKEKQGEAFRVASEIIESRLLVLRPRSNDLLLCYSEGCDSKLLAVGGAGYTYSESESIDSDRSSIFDLCTDFELVLSVDVEPTPVFSISLSIRGCPHQDVCVSSRDENLVSFCNDAEEVKFIGSLCKSLNIADGGCSIKAQVALPALEVG